MLCCVGLIGGLAVGQAMGGPWALIAPAAGFGIGLVGDMKLMKGMHGHGRSSCHAPAQAPRLPHASAGAPAALPAQRAPDAVDPARV